MAHKQNLTSCESVFWVTVAADPNEQFFHDVCAGVRGGQIRVAGYMMKLGMLPLCSGIFLPLHFLGQECRDELPEPEPIQVQSKLS